MEKKKKNFSQLEIKLKTGDPVWLNLITKMGRVAGEYNDRNLRLN